MVCFMFSSCGTLQPTEQQRANTLTQERVAISSEEFISLATTYNMEIADITEQLHEMGASEGIIESVYALERDIDVSAMFFMCDNNDNAIMGFEEIKSDIEKNSGSGVYTYKSINSDNYALYTLTVSNVVFYVCRIDNTFIYARAPKSEQQSAENFLTELGYI